MRFRYVAFVAATVAAVAWNTHASASGYHPVAETADQVMLLDVDTIIRVGEMKRGWAVVFYAKEQTTDGVPCCYNKAMVEYEVRCSSREQRVRSIVLYRPDNSVLGRVDGAERPWLGIPPETIVSTVSSVICADNLDSLQV